MLNETGIDASAGIIKPVEPIGEVKIEPKGQPFSQFPRAAGPDLVPLPAERPDPNTPQTSVEGAGEIVHPESLSPLQQAVYERIGADRFHSLNSSQLQLLERVGLERFVAMVENDYAVHQPRQADVVTKQSLQSDAIRKPHDPERRSERILTEQDRPWWQRERGKNRTATVSSVSDATKRRL